MRLLPALATSLALIICAAPASAEEGDGEKNVGYISLFNFGGYNIDPIVLHWKTPDGKKKSKKLGAKIGQGQALCYDLKKGGDVPDGSEVWLVAKIEAGENENCRKDSKHYYEEGNDRAWFLYMSGTTLNNNSCKNRSDGADDYDASTPVKGNSDMCEWLASY